jgi:tricorn protease
MPFQGYVRFPTIHQDSIVFVAEDDLWLVESGGGRAERLSAGVAEVRTPWLAPDGKRLAFVGEIEGTTEVYLMPDLGDEAMRLTFQSASCSVAGWSPAGERILFASSTGQFEADAYFLYAIDPQGGLPDLLPYGRANAISYGPQAEVIIGRNIEEPAHWKRYRGGKTGRLWCDTSGDGQFRPLLHLAGNLASPCWIDERIYFLSDHEGVGNIYSCTPAGEDLRRHTAHEDFYARNLSSDGRRIVYHAGGDLYLFDPATTRSRRVEVSLPSTRTQRNRKFVVASHHLDTWALHPQGHAVALTTRGKAFSMASWEGPVLQHGAPDGVRYRHLNWLNDGKRLVAIHDADGQEALLVFHPEEAGEARTFPDVSVGIVLHLEVSPADDQVALSNHRQELVVVNLDTGEARVVDKSLHSVIRGFAWAPDGKWLAYGFSFNAQQSAIKLYNMESQETIFASEPVLQDRNPAFDPDGKYLYFIGKRLFNPVYDNLQYLDLSFPHGEKPYAIMLRRDLRSPFIPEAKAPAEKEESAKKASNENNGAGAGPSEAGEPEENGKKENGNGKKPDLVIDLDGISERVVPFPVPDGRYVSIAGIKGKVLFQSASQETGSLPPGFLPQPRGRIECYDFETYKVEWSIDGVSSFALARDARTLIYRKFHSLRVLKASEKPKDNSERASRESGWLDLDRIKVSVLPAAEWRQMFAEAWRLQREYFWTEDMSGVDWPAIYAQYSPLIERVGSRAELSDLFWEIQGELGTSHAYEGAGDYRRPPYYRQGALAVDWTYDAQHQRYRIAHIVKGDIADPRATSPLNSPGLHIQMGDAVLAINGQRPGPGQPPQALLVNHANQEVQLTIEAAESKEVRTITVRTLASERLARYREWVEQNRALVHTRSDGRVGYLHIPDMGPSGFAEFHRGYLAEYNANGLVIDVRWNHGGHISGLLLERLARPRLAYRFSRWRQPQAYPYESPAGPMVALTNEHASSDGDKFSHSFKLMGLGPLIGTRTWGGVIGISYYHPLVDGTRTTQPTSANWFKDVGWSLENYGTEPDIEVDIAPQDYTNGHDPQLERAIDECLKLIEDYPVLRPEPGARPLTARKK